MNAARPGRSTPGFRVGLTLIAVLLVAGFLALGVWQVQRLGWKRDLVARVDARIHAAPVPAPRTAGKADEYRRITITGHFRHDQATLVQASTILGSGYWVMTPLVSDTGLTLLVNRGFVPTEAKTSYARPTGSVRITGLLRLTEPGGGFLRANDPSAHRWYSRDVAAIARQSGQPLAPYFIDAQSTGKDAPPIGGLTVISFPNNHLIYAITWFALAAMTLAGYTIVMSAARKYPRP